MEGIAQRTEWAGEARDHEQGKHAQAKADAGVRLETKQHNAVAYSPVLQILACMSTHACSDAV